jgi:hypothetical protein
MVIRTKLDALRCSLESFLPLAPWRIVELPGGFEVKAGDTTVAECGECAIAEIIAEAPTLLIQALAAEKSKVDEDVTREEHAALTSELKETNAEFSRYKKLEEAAALLVDSLNDISAVRLRNLDIEYGPLVDAVEALNK